MSLPSTNSTDRATEQHNTQRWWVSTISETARSVPETPKRDRETEMLFPCPTMAHSCQLATMGRGRGGRNETGCREGDGNDIICSCVWRYEESAKNNSKNTKTDHHQPKSFVWFLGHFFEMSTNTLTLPPSVASSPPSSSSEDLKQPSKETEGLEAQAQSQSKSTADADPEAADAAAQAAAHAHPLAQLSNLRKHVLLVIFTVATFVDVCEYSRGWPKPKVPRKRCKVQSAKKKAENSVKPKLTFFRQRIRRRRRRCPDRGRYTA